MVKGHAPPRVDSAGVTVLGGAVVDNRTPGHLDVAHRANSATPGHRSVDEAEGLRAASVYPRLVQRDVAFGPDAAAVLGNLVFLVCDAAPIGHGHVLDPQRPRAAMQQYTVVAVSIDGECVTRAATDREVRLGHGDGTAGEHDRAAAQRAQVDHIAARGCSDGGTQAPRAAVVAVGDDARGRMSRTGRNTDARQKDQRRDGRRELFDANHDEPPSTPPGDGAPGSLFTPVPFAPGEARRGTSPPRRVQTRP